MEEISINQTSLVKSKHLATTSFKSTDIQKQERNRCYSPWTPRISFTTRSHREKAKVTCSVFRRTKSYLSKSKTPTAWSYFQDPNRYKTRANLKRAKKSRARKESLRRQRLEQAKIVAFSKTLMTSVLSLSSQRSNIYKEIYHRAKTYPRVKRKIRYHQDRSKLQRTD